MGNKLIVGLIGWFLLLLISSGANAQKKELRLSTTGYLVSSSFNNEAIASLNMSLRRNNLRLGVGVLFPVYNHETEVGGIGEVAFRFLESTRADIYFSSYLVVSHGRFIYDAEIFPWFIFWSIKNTMVGLAPGVSLEVKLAKRISLEPGVYVMPRLLLPSPAKFQLPFLGKLSFSVKLNR